MKDKNYPKSREQVISPYQVASEVHSINVLRLLPHIRDKVIKRRIIEWTYLKDKILFFFALAMLTGLIIFSILIIIGRHHPYVKASSAVYLNYMILRLSTHLLKHM